MLVFLILLCNGTLCTAQSERQGVLSVVFLLYANNSVWNTVKINKSLTGPVVLLVAYCKDSVCA